MKKQPLRAVSHSQRSHRRICERHVRPDCTYTSLAIRKDRNTGAGDVKGAIDLVDDAIFDGLTPIPQALEQLRLRLLDLTGRNRLLNFKHTAGKSLPLVPTHLDDTFRRLVGSQAGKIAIQPVPDPARDE